jgi:hypothetical protein
MTASPQDQDPAELLAALVEAVPGVVRLEGGVLGEVATYLPGRKVTGVRIGPDGTDLHLVADQDADVRDVAERVHRQVAGFVPGPVHVYIDDVAPAMPSPPSKEL